MLGVIVNTVVIIIGSFIGIFFRRGIPDKIAKAVMIGVSLCVLYLGITNMIKEGASQLGVILGMVAGGFVGTLLDIDGNLTKLGMWAQSKFPDKNGHTSVAEGFITASLLFCIGAMTVNGSIMAGQGDNTMLFTKSVLDGISSVMLSVTLGLGVILSSVFVLVFEGALVALSGVILSVLSAEMTATLICAGGILILALGLNMLGITKLKVADYLPALVFAPLFALLLTYII